MKDFKALAHSLRKCKEYSMIYSEYLFGIPKKVIIRIAKGILIYLCERQKTLLFSFEHGVSLLLKCPQSLLMILRIGDH